MTTTMLIQMVLNNASYYLWPYTQVMIAFYIDSALMVYVYLNV